MRQNAQSTNLRHWTPSSVQSRAKWPAPGIFAKRREPCRDFFGALPRNPRRMQLGQHQFLAHWMMVKFLKHNKMWGKTNWEKLKKKRRITSASNGTDGPGDLVAVVARARASAPTALALALRAGLFAVLIRAVGAGTQWYDYINKFYMRYVAQICVCVHLLYIISFVTRLEHYIIDLFHTSPPKFNQTDPGVTSSGQGMSNGQKKGENSWCFPTKNKGFRSKQAKPGDTHRGPSSG